MSISALALVLALAAPAGEGAPPPKPPAAEAGAPAPAPAPKPARLIIELRDGEGGKTGSGRCRVTVDGRAILPADAIMVGDGWFVVDGSLKMTVPPGECRLEVDGGPTRLPYDRTMSLTAGASEEKTIFLLRPEQYAFERAGWCLADPFYSAGTAGPEAAAAAARATGLAAVGLDSPELAAGRVPRWATRYPAICWKLDADPRYGSKITLSGGEERFTFYADCSAPRRVNPWKTLVPWRPELREFYDPMVEATTGLAPRMYYEFLAGTPVGGFEIDGSEAAQKLWFALLDHGWRVPAVAGSRRALSAGAWPEPRMLIRSEGRPETAKLVSALRAGRSTLSFGPYCFMAIEGRAPGESKGPGDEIALERGERRIMVRAVATTQRRAEIARIELWRNGKVIKTWQCAPGETVATVDAIAEMDEPGWVLAKCYQRLRAGDSFESGPDRGPETIAYTNPLWIVPKNYRGSLSPVETRPSAGSWTTRPACR